MNLNQLVTKSDLTKLRQDIVNIFERIIKETSTNKKEWLRTSEACEFMGVAASTLQNYRAKGLLTPKKVEGTLYYSRKQLNNLINQ